MAAEAFVVMREVVSAADWRSYQLRIDMTIVDGVYRGPFLFGCGPDPAAADDDLKSD